MSQMKVSECMCVCVCVCVYENEMFLYVDDWVSRDFASHCGSVLFMFVLFVCLFVCMHVFSDQLTGRAVRQFCWSRESIQGEALYLAPLPRSPLDAKNRWLFHSSEEWKELYCNTPFGEKAWNFSKTNTHFKQEYGQCVMKSSLRRNVPDGFSSLCRPYPA